MLVRRRDVVILLKDVDEVVITKHSVSRVSTSTHLTGARQLLGGCWFVRACWGSCDAVKLSRELDTLMKSFGLEGCHVPESFDVEFYSGKFSLGSPEGLSEITSYVLEMVGEYVAPTHGYTVTLKKVKINRTITTEGSSEAREEKNLVELHVKLMTEGSHREVSQERAVIMGLERNVGRVFEEMFRVARERATALVKAKGPNLSDMGKSEVVLIREASPALFYELSRLLTASRGRRLIGKRLFDGPNVRICDNPADFTKPSARVFDDEGVAARKRWLIEGGIVVDLHHSIKTAYELGSYPGSTHGLLEPFHLHHASLVVESGDWKDSELVEETKKGFLVDGVTRTSLEGGYVRLIPQVSFRIERGDVAEPVHVRSIKIPLVKAIKILGVGKTGYTKVSHSPSGEFATETAPPVKIEAYVEI